MYKKCLGSRHKRIGRGRGGKHQAASRQYRQETAQCAPPQKTSRSQNFIREYALRGATAKNATAGKQHERKQRRHESTQ